MRGLIFIFMLFLSCSPVKIVNVDKQDEFKLSNYETFNFYNVNVNGDTLDKPYQENIKILTKEITKALEKKGLRWTQDEPDLLINIGIVTEEKIQTRTTNFPNDAPKYAGQRNYSWKSQEVEVGKYKSGTVTVHLVDRILNKMMWRGVAEGVISNNQARLKKDIGKGVEKLFSKLNSPDTQ